MARTKKSPDKRNADATDLSLSRKKAGNVKGGWFAMAAVAVSIRDNISREKRSVDDDQSRVQFEIQ